MQHLVHRLNVLFQNPVELERLTVSQADAAVDGVISGKFIDRFPLRRGDNPTRQTAAQQHRVARLQLLRGTFSADIAVILLVHAVKTDQQEVIAVEAAGQAVVEIFRDGTAQEVTLTLHTLGVSQFAFDH